MKKKLFFLSLVVLCAANMAIAGNNAKFIRASVPSEVFVGDKFTVLFEFQNTGTTTWKPLGSKSYWLGSENPRDNFTWGTNRGGMVNKEVLPNGRYTFVFTLTAPNKPGTYNCQWQMLQNFVQWFGEKSPNFRIAVRPKGDASEVVYTRGCSKICAGRRCYVTIKMKNTGTTTWTPQNGFVLKAINGGSPGIPSTLTLNRNVGRDETYTFNYSFIASFDSDPVMDWKMYHGGTSFGAIARVHTRVINCDGPDDPWRPFPVNSEVKFFPNPTNKDLNIQGIKGDAELSIIDLNGVKRVNRKCNGEDNVNIDISSLQKGIYIVTLKSGDEVVTEKLLIE